MQRTKPSFKINEHFITSKTISEILILELLSILAQEQNQDSRLVLFRRLKNILEKRRKIMSYVTN